MASIVTDRLDGLSSTTAYKGPCRLASPVHVTPSGLRIVDGVQTVSNDRVVLTDQDDLRQNGIYVVDTGPWRRAADFNKTKDMVKGTRVWVTEGDSGPAELEVASENPVRIGVDAITFELAASSANAVALSQAVQDAEEDANRAEDARDVALDAASDAASQSNVPIYATTVTLAALSVPVAINTIRLNGRNTIGDGLGGLYVDANNGSEETWPSGDGRTWYRTKDVAYDRLGDTVFTNPAGALRKTGGTMSGTLKFENGLRDPITGNPVVTIDGMMSFFGDQLRFWPDTDGDGDYDADILAKSNMYLVSTAAFHLIPGKDLTTIPSVTAPGRHVFRANNVANYFQAGGNYGGDWFKDLIITRYGAAAPWMVFDESQGGRVGIGTLLPTATEVVNGISRELYQPGAKLHVIDSTQRVVLIESTGATSRLGFKDPATTVEPTIGSAGDELLFRVLDVSKLRISATAVRPAVDNSLTLGTADFRWAGIFSATPVSVTSDLRQKDVEASISDDFALSMLQAIEPKLFRYKVGGVDTHTEDDGFEEREEEEEVLVPVDAEGKEIETPGQDQLLYEKRIIKRTVREPKRRVVETERQGDRLHAGFISQDVKAAMDAVGVDFAAWGLEDKSDPNSAQFIIPDELLAVLWAAVRKQQEQIDDLRTLITGA